LPGPRIGFPHVGTLRLGKVFQVPIQFQWPQTLNLPAESDRVELSSFVSNVSVKS
jgi:hypothetical protein